MSPNLGDVIQGKYRIVRLIGDGGMGSVYEAHHEYLGIQVALKFLHPELARRPGLVTRFLREGQVAASIKSPHITQVLDVDRTPDGSAFLVMELLSGESLQALLERTPRLPREVALDYTLQILAGLEVAHAAGVVHRDLKPDNVFVVASPGGPLVKVLDFGIAKLHQAGGLTRPGALMGTPEYMAPEQADSADRVDMRADLFAVGAMLYEMLSGQRPTQGADARQIAAMLRAQGIVPLNQLDPTIPEGLAAAVHRALAADPAHRFANVADFRAALLPHCGTLSPAGRLAATPTPPIVAELSPRLGGGLASFPPQAPQAPRSVAPTLPPEDEAPPRPSRTLDDEPSGGFRDATEAMPAFSPELIGYRERTGPMAAFPQGTSAGGAPYYREATGKMPAYAAPPFHQPPPHIGNPAAFSPPAYAQPPAPPARKRRRSGFSLGLLAAASGAGLALIVLLVVMMRSSSSESLPSLPPAATEPISPAPIPEAVPEPPAAAIPTILPPTEPAKVPQTPAPSKPRPAPTTPTAPPAAPDAGAPVDAGTDAGGETSPGGFPTAIPLPPNLPPGFPTALPLPEGLPPLPIPIPGWSKAAPAPSAM